MDVTVRSLSKRLGTVIASLAWLAAFAIVAVGALA
jgi:hypothetical protein